MSPRVPIAHFVFLFLTGIAYLSRLPTPAQKEMLEIMEKMDIRYTSPRAKVTAIVFFTMLVSFLLTTVHYMWKLVKTRKQGFQQRVRLLETKIKDLKVLLTAREKERNDMRKAYNNAKRHHARNSLRHAVFSQEMHATTIQKEDEIAALKAEISRLGATLSNMRQLSSQVSENTHLLDTVMSMLKAQNDQRALSNMHHTRIAASVIHRLGNINATQQSMIPIIREMVRRVMTEVMAKQTQEELEGLRTRIAYLSEIINTLSKNKANLAKNKANLQSKLRNLENALHGKQLELDGLTNAMEDLGKQFNDQVTIISKIQQKRASNDAKRNQNVASALQIAQTARDEKDKIAVSLEALQKEILSIEGKVAEEKSKKVEAMKARIETLKERRRELTNSKERSMNNYVQAIQILRRGTKERGMFETMKNRAHAKTVEHVALIKELNVVIKNLEMQLDEETRSATNTSFVSVALN